MHILNPREIKLAINIYISDLLDNRFFFLHGAVLILSVNLRVYFVVVIFGL